MSGALTDSVPMGARPSALQRALPQTGPVMSAAYWAKREIVRSDPFDDELGHGRTASRLDFNTAFIDDNTQLLVTALNSNDTLSRAGALKDSSNAASDCHDCKHLERDLNDSLHSPVATM